MICSIQSLPKSADLSMTPAQRSDGFIPQRSDTRVVRKTNLILSNYKYYCRVRAYLFFKVPFKSYAGFIKIIYLLALAIVQQKIIN